MGGSKEVWIAASAMSLAIAGQSRAETPALRAGVAAYVAPSVEKLSEGRLKRVRIGDDVFSDQKIVTSSTGRVQLLLRDRSAITIGPDSELTIARYAFDSRDSTGEMLIESAKGLARFVGGLLSKKQPVRVATTVGTIGIRGAIVIVEHLPDGGLLLVFLYGDLAEFTAGDGRTEQLTSPGFGLRVGPDGTPGEPYKLAAADIAALVGRLEGSGPPVEVSDAVSQALGGAAQVLDIELGDTPLQQIELLQDDQGSQQADQDLTDTFLEGAGTGGL